MGFHTSYFRCSMVKVWSPAFTSHFGSRVDCHLGAVDSQGFGSSAAVRRWWVQEGTSKVRILVDLPSVVTELAQVPVTGWFHFITPLSGALQPSLTKSYPRHGLYPIMAANISLGVKIQPFTPLCIAICHDHHQLLLVVLVAHILR